MEMYSNNSKYMFILYHHFLNIFHVEMHMYYIIQINPLAAVSRLILFFYLKEN